MKYTLILLMVVVLACGEENKVSGATASQDPQKPLELEVYDFNGLEKFLHLQDTKVHVVNFWATWCVPCVQELPYFEKLQKEYKSQQVDVLLVSLDFPNQYEKKLKPFLRKHNLRSKVIALDDVDMNTWLPKVDENWSGAIPATLIYTKGKRQFYERAFTYEALENEVKQFINEAL